MALRCPGCEFERSTLAESISDAGGGAGSSTSGRAPTPSNSLRERNFQTILEAVGRLREGQALSRSWLRPRWFLRAAERRGWNALGIEPDPRHRAVGCRMASPVRSGMFPQALRGRRNGST